MSVKTTLSYLPGAIGIYLLYGLLRALPMDTASRTGGWLMRKIGPRLSRQRIARRNLAYAMPELDEQQREAIIDDMWDQLGRNAAEFFWLNHPRFHERVTITERGKALLKHYQDKKQPMIIASGHLGNWEVGPLAMWLAGEPTTAIYRHINNAWADALVKRIRSHHTRSLHPKGRYGALALARALKSGYSVGMLIDQRMNEGRDIPFFGNPAMTATAAAEWAIKYRAPIILGCVIRGEGVQFTLDLVESPVIRAGDYEEQVYHTMTSLNDQLEQWIRAYPAQWLWVHKRWG